MKAYVIMRNDHMLSQIEVSPGRVDLLSLKYSEENLKEVIIFLSLYTASNQLVSLTTAGVEGLVIEEVEL